ncbi:outer membrane beta-barrel protein [Verrucomicrobium sp. BvORR106]|uniref:outer membrane protein n=1 Tax=Verrucomicrobium sp. BvORR106 TaxID=1403819 RepID=UPI00056E6A7B|nr:outer membrane beta-barrel protein [Verrucomicrobium sp. BvORR106]
MKLKTSTLTLLATIALASGHALAGPVSYSGKGTVEPPITPPPPAGFWYGQIHGGVSWLEDVEAEGASLSFDAGWAVSGAVGYEWASGFALELEVGYLQSDTGDFHYRGHDLGVDADFRQVPILFSGLYRIKFTDRLSLQLGAGAGIAWSEVDGNSVEGIPVGFLEDDWNFAFQAKAVLAYAITETINLDLSYRFLYNVDAFAGADDGIANILGAGLTFKF